MDSRLKALSVAVSVYTLPNTVVRPMMSSSGELNAAKIAMASSVDMTYLGLVQLMHSTCITIMMSQRALLLLTNARISVDDELPPRCCHCCGQLLSYIWDPIATSQESAEGSRDCLPQLCAWLNLEKSIGLWQ
jgi:hypothetical protein